MDDEKRTHGLAVVQLGMMESIRQRVTEIERQRVQTQTLGGTAEHEEILAQLDCEGHQAREQLNMCLSAGIDPDEQLLRLSTTTLGALISMRWSAVPPSDHELLIYERDRAEYLRDGAVAQAQRFKRERDDARAELDRLRIVAEYGRAFMELVEQLDRLRRQPHELTGFEFDIPSSIAALRSEIDEVEAETPGTERSHREGGDVLGAAVQLVLVLGDSPLHSLTLVARKLCARLDLVECRGLTWLQAKAELRGLEDR